MYPRLLLTVLLCSSALTAQREFVATQQDDSALRGTLDLKSVKIKTSFGSAVVQHDSLLSITFGQPDEVLTSDNTRLRGEVLTRVFRLRDGSRRHNLRGKDLKSIVSAELADLAGFGGAWSTNFGPLHLEQQGASVQGTYGYNKTKISGQIEGDTLKLKYASGTVDFELEEDGALLLGRYSGSGREGFWGGYRIAAKQAQAAPGEIRSGQTASWLNYHLRVPKDYQAGKSYPAIAILHGSNMSARAYVHTIASAWPKLAERYILVGFDGQNLSPRAKPGQRAYNYDYVNFSGHEVGSEGRYRQSPALVAEALDELRAQLKIQHWFLGGHSQGGFLTYAVGMFYPGKLRGIFPMSCNLLVQCDPDYFKDEEVRRQQRELAIAVIHAANDQVVPVSGGDYCHAAMVDGGFPMLRYFRDPRAAHMFARLPVEAAIGWMEQITSEEPDTLLAFAAQGLQAEDFRSASAALLRLQALPAASQHKPALNELRKKLDAKARPAATRLRQQILADADGSWVDGFLEFRKSFAFAPASRGAMEAYAALRSKHAEPAQKLYYAARRLRDKAEREAKYREIVTRYYASKWYPLVSKWLQDD